MLLSTPCVSPTPTASNCQDNSNSMRDASPSSPRSGPLAAGVASVDLRTFLAPFRTFPYRSFVLENPCSLFCFPFSTWLLDLERLRSLLLVRSVHGFNCPHLASAKEEPSVQCNHKTFHSSSLARVLSSPQTSVLRPLRHPFACSRPFGSAASHIHPSSPLHFPLGITNPTRTLDHPQPHINTTWTYHQCYITIKAPPCGSRKAVP
jgi:hypothetical protein